MDQKAMFYRIEFSSVDWIYERAGCDRQPQQSPQICYEE